MQLHFVGKQLYYGSILHRPILLFLLVEVFRLNLTEFHTWEAAWPCACHLLSRGNPVCLCRLDVAAHSAGEAHLTAALLLTADVWLVKNRCRKKSLRYSHTSGCSFYIAEISKKHSAEAALVSTIWEYGWAMTQMVEASSKSLKLHVRNWKWIQTEELKSEPMPLMLCMQNTSFFHVSLGFYNQYGIKNAATLFCCCCWASH